MGCCVDLLVPVPVHGVGQEDDGFGEVSSGEAVGGSSVGVEIGEGMVVKELELVVSNELLPLRVVGVGVDECTARGGLVVSWAIGTPALARRAEGGEVHWDDRMCWRERKSRQWVWLVCVFVLRC